MATLIISLLLSIVVFVQSCAAGVGGSLGKELGQSAAEKADAEKLSGAAGFGVLGGLLWIVGAGLVMPKPRISMWLYGVAALLLLGAGASGYSDAYIWAVASAAFAAMSWRGVTEKERAEERGRARYQADLTTAAAAAAAQAGGTAPQAGGTAPVAQVSTTGAGWHPDPQDVGKLRYWDGQQWTDRTADLPN